VPDVPRVLITDCDHGFYDPEEAVARERGVELNRAEGSRETIIRLGAEADGILCQYFRVDGELLDGLPRCRVVGRYGVGLDNVDLEATAARGLKVVNVPDFCVDEVADHAVGLALSATRRIVQLDRDWRLDPAGYARRWVERFEGLAGVERSSRQRLGLVGFGRIGRAVAHRAAGFGFSIVAHDPLVAVPTSEASTVDLDELLRTSDVISLHTPATPETVGMIDARAVGLMKPGSVLVNTSRGALIDEQALANGLREGRPGFAALDVFADEPLPSDHPFFALPNVTLTPHIAFFSRTSLIEVKHRAITSVIDAIERAA
jgi:D-3-phosphoglycerate dehydrogenase